MATEEKEKKTTDESINVGNQESAPSAASSPSDSPTMTAEDLNEANKQRKQACAREVNQVLKKYGCDFSARVLVTEHGNFPQVFIVDAQTRS